MLIFMAVLVSYHQIFAMYEHIVGNYIYFLYELYDLQIDKNWIIENRYKTKTFCQKGKTGCVASYKALINKLCDHFLLQ